MDSEVSATKPHQYPATKDDLFQALEGLDIAFHTLEHPPVFTVEESSDVEAALPGAHTKNLFLKDAKGRLFLVVAENRTEIDLKALPAVIGSKRLSFAKPDLLMEVLGVEPGSVSALCVINDRDVRVRVVVDAALMVHESINCHPLKNDATTNISRDDLFRFIRKFGHEPTVVALTS
ncbi:MAG: prolyl-tRNA synthetase associated domain-containing protein [Hyphomicrobiaceae bacterium]